MAELSTPDRSPRQQVVPSVTELDIQPLSPLPMELILPPGRVMAIWDIVAEGVTRYGIRVEVVDLGVVKLDEDGSQDSVKLPKTGSFDGLNIQVIPELVLSERIFTLLHLFGHTVQCCSPSEGEIVNKFNNKPDEITEKLSVLADYEFRAAQFSLQLLHELGIRDIDRWFTDFVHTDHNMVAQTYRAGALPRLFDCLVTNKELIKPAPIPEDFKPRLLENTSVAF